jgi:hypothetical protein
MAGGAVRGAIWPEQLLDPRRLAVVGTATVAMPPASAFVFWLVQHQVHDRLPQLAVGFVMGVVAPACFGLALALLTGQRPTVIAKARTRLGPDAGGYGHTCPHVYLPSTGRWLPPRSMTARPPCSASPWEWSTS